MQNHNAATNEHAKEESSPNSFTPLGANLKQAVTEWSGVRHAHIGTMLPHMLGYPGEAGLYAIRPSKDFVLYRLTARLKGVTHE